MTARARLLVVDDDPTMRSAMCDLAKMWGLSARSAEDGFTALAAIRQEMPDILLSDLNMPGMSGFELLSVVRRRFPSIKVIAMSGAFSDAGQQPGVAADAFYAKGSSLNLLSAFITAFKDPQSPPWVCDRSSVAPIWIPSNGHDPAGEACVTISCPECLRPFPQVYDDDGALIQQTGCVYCGSVIHFAVLLPTDPATPQAFQHRRRPSLPLSR